MSPEAVAPPPVVATTAAPPAPSLSDNLDVATVAAPSLAQAPALALDVAQSPGDTVAQAQTVAQAKTTQENAAAIDHTNAAVGGGNIVSDVFGWLGHNVIHPIISAGADALNELNVTQRFIQHEYRYLHDVEATHGMFAAIAEGALITAAGVGGTIATGGDLAAGGLAAEGTTAALGQVAYRSSWDRTASSTYVDPHTHQRVSFGRDIASGFLGLHKGAIYHIVSGLGDATFDMAMDPGQLGLREVAKPYLEGGGTVFGMKYQGTALNPENIEAAANGPRSLGRFNRMVDALVDAQTPADVNRLDRRFAPIAGDTEVATDPIRDNEVSAFRCDKTEGTMLDAEHPQGAYYTPRGSPSSYGAHGGVRSEVFISKDGALNVGDSTNPQAWNAGTAAIEKIAGPEELARLTAMQTRDPRLVADELESKFGVTLPPKTGSELDVYGAQLAKRAGYKSIHYTEKIPGYNDEVVAISKDAMRAPTGYTTLPGLAGADSRDKVLDILKHASTSPQYLNSSKLPTLSLARVGTIKLHEAMANAEQPIVKAIRGAAPTIADRNPLQTRLATLAANAAKPDAGRLTKVVSHLAGQFSNPIYRARSTAATAASVFSPRAWADRLERLPGVEMNANSLKFGTPINPADSNAAGANDLWAFMRTSLPARVADDTMNLWYAADTRGRITIARNAIMDVILGHAGMDLQRAGETTEEYLSHTSFEDPTLRSKIATMLDHYAPTAEPGPEAAYGGNPYGKASANLVDANTGRRMAAAVDTLQSGDITLPSIHDVKRMGQAIEGTKHLFGAVDDFAFNNITGAFFKPLVLQSGGYAFHIALAETIPNMLRQGLVATARAHLLASYAKLSTKAAAAAAVKEDLPGFSGWIWHMMDQSPAKLRNLIGSPKDFEYAVEYGQATNGYGRFAGTGAGENIGAEMNRAERVKSSVRSGAANINMKAGSQFGMFGPEDSPRRLSEWQSWNRRLSAATEHRVAASTYERSRIAGKSEAEASNDAWIATTKHLDAMSPREQSKWLRLQHHSENSVPGETLSQDWAHQIVENMKGATHSAKIEHTAEDGTITHSGGEPNMDLVHAMANGRTPPLSRFKQLVHEGNAPLKVPGRLLVADGDGSVKRIAGWGFEKVLNPMVNLISRDSTTLIEYMKVRRAMQPSVDAGILTDEQASTIASGRSVAQTARFIHNIHDRTQWTDTLRNWAPFFFAQEQAYRRAGRLLAENPAAFRLYQLEVMSVHNVTVQQQDGQGNQYIAFPGQGFLTQDMGQLFAKGMGVPVSSISPLGIGGTMSSMNVVFPLSEGFRPGWGPVVTIPMRELYNKFSELSQKYPDWRPLAQPATAALQTTVGTAGLTGDMWKEFVPNTFIQRVIETATGDDRAFQSTMMQVAASLSYQQNLAMSKWVADGSVGPEPNIVPGPGATVQEKQAFIDRVRNQTRIAYGIRALVGFWSPVSADVQVNNWGLSAELTAEINKAGSVSTGMQNFLLKNPDATPYTVAQSTTPYGGSLSSSAQAETWIQANEKLINAYPAASMWLMPQLTDNTYDPTVYNEQIAAGQRVKRTPAEFVDALYVAAGDQTYYAAVAQHTAALQAANGDKYATDAEYTKWDAWVQQLGISQPTWYADHLSGQKQVNAQQTIKELTEIFTKGLAPKSAQSTAVQGILAAYGQASQDYTNAQQSYNYATLEKQVKSQWATYLNAQEVADPSLKPIITSVFRDILYARTS